MPLALIALGSNLGQREANIVQAIEQLDAHRAVRVTSRSGMHGTAPAGGPAGQPDFVNAAVQVETSLPPQALLHEMLRIETQLGRERLERWGPRTLDLDLLLYEDVVLHSAELSLPHPRMAHRRFVLEPAAVAAPHMVHPELGSTVAGMLDHLNHSAPYFAVTGPTGCGKSTLVAAVAQAAGMSRIDEPVDDASLAQYYGDPASAAYRVELEILRLRTALLAPAAQAGNLQGAGAVSDFWFDQARAFARLSLTASDFAQFEAAWAEAHAAVLQPRLVVVMKTAATEVERRIQKRGRQYEANVNPADIERLQNAIEDVARHARTPLLYLDGADTATARDELLATIGAMR